MSDEKCCERGTYVPGPDVSVRLTGRKGALLYHPDHQKERLLNATGLFIWQRLDGCRPLRQIAEEIEAHFEGSPYGQALKDAGAFLADLNRQGLVLKPASSRPLPANKEKYPHMNDAPLSFDISLTGRCNLECAYCFYAHEMSSRGDLKGSAWFSFFEELGQMAVREVCLSGGEVFIRPDLWDLIDAMIDNRMRYSILTNGTLITEKTIDEISKGRRLDRLNSVQVSIDGSCAAVHDQSRGKGSFEKAVRGLRLLFEAGLPVTSRVTVNQTNVDDLDNIARFLLDDIGIPGFSTNDAMPMGAGCFHQDSIVLEPGQQVAAMKSLSRLSEKYKGRITATAGPLAIWRSYREMEHAMASGEKSTRWVMGVLSACGCVFNKLAVHHDGVITPCNMLSGLELGRINEDSIREIWTGHPILKALKERRSIPMERVPGCEDCRWAPFCNGSCPGLAYEMTGDFNRANPHDCYRLFLAATGGKKG
ncbi:MAG: SynChlorMet cassette radical SAM/SPASM protein ScmE [Pseudomonadota bacterium]